jgi:hypothetical protein
MTTLGNIGGLLCLSVAAVLVVGVLLFQAYAMFWQWNNRRTLPTPSEGHDEFLRLYRAGVAKDGTVKEAIAYAATLGVRDPKLLVSAENGARLVRQRLCLLRGDDR